MHILLSGVGLPAMKYLDNYDDSFLSSTVETLIKLRDDRDELDKKWRRTLLKNWDAARQRKV